MTLAPVPREHRYTRAHPCPICEGYDSARRGQGVRCYGFLAEGGEYAHCTREDFAGMIEPTRAGTYGHRMHGPCKCGTTHGPALITPMPARRIRRVGSNARQGARAATDGTAARPIVPADGSGGDQDMPDAGDTAAPGGTPRTPRRELVRAKRPICYDYCGPDGALSFQVLRWPLIDPRTGEIVAKTFQQRRPSGSTGEHSNAGRGGWLYNLHDTPRVLYRLPALLAADTATPVFVCEGEKDADALAALGMIATTSAGGARNWHLTAEHARAVLAGRPVVMLPDHDADGARYAASAAASLAGVAASVRVVSLADSAPDLPAHGGDVSDWLALGGTAAALVQIAEAAPLWTPPDETLEALDAPDTADGTSQNASARGGRGGRGGHGGHGRRHGGRQGGTTDGSTPGDSNAAALVPIPGTPWYLSTSERGRQLWARAGRGGREASAADMADTNADGADGLPLAGYAPVNVWGVPQVHALVMFSADEAMSGRRALFDLSIEGQRERIGWGELHSGECWERWGTLGIAGRAAFAHYAATVEHIARLDGVPRHQGSRATGWIVHEGRHALTLPSGALVGAGGMIEGAQVYLDINSKHTAPYAALAQTSQPDAPPDIQAAALAFLARVGQRSTGALVLCAHLRSIMYGVLRSDFSLVVRGTSGRGKTGITSWCRNLTGAFEGWPTPPATASFSDTVTATEDALSQLKHLPMTLDDLAIRGDEARRERDEKARMMDTVLRSVGNNTPIRERMTRTLERQIARKIDACPILTAERLPSVLASALNRAVVLNIGEQDINTDALKDEGNTHAAGLRALGHGLIAYIARLWDEQGDTLAASWHDWQRTMDARIEHELAPVRARLREPRMAQRLASNGAHLLLAAHVLAAYCREAGIACPLAPDALYRDLLDHLSAQVDTISALAIGGDDDASGAPFPVWVAEQIRHALATQEAHAKNTDGTDAITHTLYAPEHLGYRRTASGEWQPAPLYLGNISADGVYLAADVHSLYLLLKRAARREGRAWDIGEKELAPRLCACDVAARDADGRHAMRRLQIANRRERRLFLRGAAIWPDVDGEPDAGDTPPDPSDGPPDTLDTPDYDALAWRDAQDTGQDGGAGDTTPAPDAPAPMPDLPAAQIAAAVASAPPDGAQEGAPWGDLLSCLPDDCRDIPRWQRAAQRYDANGRPRLALRTPGGPPYVLSGRPLFDTLATFTTSGDETRVAYAYAFAAWLAGSGPEPGAATTDREGTAS